MCGNTSLFLKPNIVSIVQIIPVRNEIHDVFELYFYKKL